MTRDSYSKEVKERIRMRIWNLMEKTNVALFPRPVYNRIPNFVGAEVAAMKLASMDIFKNSKVVKVNPDSPQKHVRYLALLQNKVVVMPTPRIKDGFLVLDPSRIPRDKYAEASTIAGAYRYGIPVKPWLLPKIDLVVIGSVAVNTGGARLGKGEGYAELEYAILRMMCKVAEDTYVVTTVHDIQIVDDDIPVEPYDVNVDIIVTPTRVIYINPRPPKPKGIIWELLPEEKLRSIPILRELKDKFKSVKDIFCR
ncbi:MAG: 5-formyltetrahydrofolate cyclo-ligase [Desulfurococcaceae archaeon]|jgi:5-formyltetrahydrofolate cyclo-ligase|nr:5-formyltetrahydrofolate cyclo-ligase [Desulfurococcaceae archaeon]